MKTMYVISKQFYDVVYIYGVFSSDELDSALAVLALENLDTAEKEHKEEKRWYEGHLRWAKGSCEFGCEHMPLSLKVSLMTYSKSLFTITELKSNTLYKYGVYVG